MPSIFDGTYTNIKADPLTIEKLHDSINLMKKHIDTAFALPKNIFPPIAMHPSTATEIKHQFEELEKRIENPWDSLGIVNFLNGMTIHKSEYLVKTIQTRYPRCNKKKKRIVKKFAKKYTITIPSSEVILFNPDEIFTKFKFSYQIF